VGDRENTAGACVAAVEGAEQISAIRALRRDHYPVASEFQALTAQVYAWTESDRRGVVLAVWDASGAALSTMSGIVATGRAAAEVEFECTLSDEPGRFPALVLSRSATRVDQRARGLNSLLRYYFIEAAQRAGLASTLSIFFQGAPRLPLLGRLGYEFTVLPGVTWESVRPHDSPLLGCLRRERMTAACGILQELLGDSLKRYPWRGPPLALAAPSSPGG
jgi:hypothetical protein